MSRAILNDVLLIPDFLGWITGRWAEQLRRELAPHRSLTCPSWLLRRRPALFRWLARHSRVVLNLDPWFAGAAVREMSRLAHRTLWASMIHHFNENDPNAVCVAEADLCIAACEDSQRRLLEMGKGQKKVLLVENGVDLEEFRPLDRVECRRRLGFDSRKLAVGFVGKASSDSGGRKGLETLARVVAALSREEVELVICGKGWDGWCRDMRERGATVRQMGFLDRKCMPAFYSSLDVLLITSRNEAGPATLLEAMSCATPAVATRTGIVPKVVVPGENGYSLEPGDVDGFVRILKKLAGSRRDCSSLGAKARATVADNWSWHDKLNPLVRAIEVHLRSDGHSSPLIDWTAPARRTLERLAQGRESRHFVS